MAAERDPVRVHLPLAEERLDDVVGRDHGADGGVRRRQTLCAEDQVRADVIQLRPEPRAETAEPGDDLVGAEQDPVTVADLPDTAPVARGRGERAAGVLDGLHDHHRDRLRACLHDRRVEVVEKERGERLLALVRRAVVAIRIAHVHDVGHERLERRAQRGDAVDRERAHRRPVVRETARDRLPAALAARLVVLARELPGRLHRLRAAGDEEHAVEVARRQLRDLVRELDRPRVRVRPVGVERQLAHLGERGLPHLLAVRVADLDRE